MNELLGLADWSHFILVGSAVCSTVVEAAMLTVNPLRV